jgi:hypothetical protein
MKTYIVIDIHNFHLIYYKVSDNVLIFEILL